MTNLELTDVEIDLLKLIVAAELKIKDDRESHALSHQCEFTDAAHLPLANIWGKLNGG